MLTVSDLTLLMSPALPALTHWRYSLGLVVVVALALGALGALVAFVRWRGLRVAAVADRVVVYAVLAGLLLSFYVGASLVLTSLLPARSYIYGAAAVLMALFVAVTYAPASVQVQRLVDTLLYRDYYDYEKTLQRFSRELAAAHDIETVTSVLLDGMIETMNLSGAALALLPEGLEPGVLAMLDPEDLRARGVYATPEGRDEALRRLAELGAPVAPGGRNARLSLAAPLVLNPWRGCAALLLIGAPEGEASSVAALLTLGAKVAGGPLRREDRALLMTLGHQAATALANAQLVNGLRISLQQLEASSRQLDEARTEQELLLRELVNADERQRASLARELHDDALQEVLYVIRHSQLAVRLAENIERGAESAPLTLTPIALPGDSASQLAPTASRMRRELRELAERSKIVEKKLRALCLGLYPDMLHSLGLTPALDDLAEQVRSSLQMDALIEYDERAAQVVEQIDPQAALHIYRIAQEALSNANKHGRASAAWVRLWVTGADPATPSGSQGENEGAGARVMIHLEVRDNGWGIPLPVDYGGSLKQGHLGLASMRERAQLIGGRLTFERPSEGGTRVALVAPAMRALPTRGLFAATTSAATTGEALSGSIISPPLASGERI